MTDTVAPDAALLESVARRLGGQGQNLPQVRWRRPDAVHVQTLVADGASTLIYGPAGRDKGVILSVSNDRFPEVVATSAKRARDAAAMLSADTARAVVCPLVEDRIDGRSLAVWPRYTPMPGSPRMRRLCAVAMAGRVADVLARMAAETARDIAPDAVEARLSTPIRDLAELPFLAPHVRAFAETALDLLDGEAGRYVTVLQHGDLWFGNVLLSRGRTPRIIDWGQARRRGFPFTDLLRYLASARVPSPIWQHAVRRYSAGAGISQTGIPVYVAAALGALAGNLDQFQPERFAALAETLTQAAERAV